MSVSSQYVGFEPKFITRDYTFVVRDALAEPLYITFSILNKAFTSRRLSFQNAPDICSLKLHREIVDLMNNPLKTHYKISDAELDDYERSHGSKIARGFYPRKVLQIS